jgi:hypothetical protein
MHAQDELQGGPARLQVQLFCGSSIRPFLVAPDLDRLPGRIDDIPSLIRQLSNFRDRSPKLTQVRFREIAAGVKLFV